jgi:hypothetical protein
MRSAVRSPLRGGADFCRTAFVTFAHLTKLIG